MRIYADIYTDINTHIKINTCIYFYTCTHIQNRRVRALLAEFNAQHKLVCGLGAGLLALKEANVLHARSVAAPPQIRAQLARENLGPVAGNTIAVADENLQGLLGEGAWAGDDAVMCV